MHKKEVTRNMNVGIEEQHFSYFCSTLLISFYFGSND